MWWPALAAIAWIAEGLRVAAARRPGLPLWDEAAQGFDGVRVADALRRLDLLALLRALNDQVVWPPVHSLLSAPAFLVAGPVFAAAPLVSLALYAAAALAVAACAARMLPRRAAWGGLLALALLLAAPYYRAFGVLGMLEMPGAFLLALTLALHLAATRPDPPPRTLAWAGVTTTLLMLHKYNYGLLWLAPLALHEWWLLDGAARSAARARAGAWLRAGGWRRPMPLLVLSWLVFLAAVQLTGGFAFEALGRRVSVRSAGNGAYALLLVLVAWAAAWAIRHPARRRAAWEALPPRLRSHAKTVLAPLLAWFLLPWPNRVRALVDFATNRSTGPAPWSPEGLAYYPEAFVRDYSAWPWLGGIVLAMALVPPPRGADPRGRAFFARQRLAYAALLVGLGATMLHRYHDPRFLFTTALLVWLNAARTAVTALDAGLARAPRPLRLAAWAALGAALAAAPFLAGPSADRVLGIRDGFRSDASMLEAVDSVVALARGEDTPPALLGYSNPLSPGLVSWRARQVAPRLATSALPRRLPWLDAGAEAPALAARLDRALLPGRRIVAALPEPGARAWSFAYSCEVWADSVTLHSLRRSPRVLAERDTLLGDSGFRLASFRVKIAP